jgi:superfamily II RNA helicase
VNFPARTIVVLNSDRFNGRDFLPLTPTEFHQMTGRAGRRGMDNIGFALVVPGKFMDTHLMAKLFSTASSDVASQIRIDFSMVLNLLLSHSPDQVKELLDKSFAAFMLKTGHNTATDWEQPAADARLLWGDFLRHLDFLKEKEYVTDDDRLTDDGQWASQLRIDHPLMVAEGFRNQLFPKSDPAILAGIMASFVNERETDDDAIDTSKIPKTLFKNFKKIDRGLKPFAEEMRINGFASPTLYFLPCLTIYLWARGAPWEKALEVSKMAEGDLAMLILRTADNLRHIGNLKGVFPDAAKTAIEAVDLILRDPVVAAYGD